MASSVNLGCDGKCSVETLPSRITARQGPGHAQACSHYGRDTLTPVCAFSSLGCAQRQEWKSVATQLLILRTGAPGTVREETGSVWLQHRADDELLSNLRQAHKMESTTCNLSRNSTRLSPHTRVFNKGTLASGQTAVKSQTRFNWPSRNRKLHMYNIYFFGLCVFCLCWLSLLLCR